MQGILGSLPIDEPFTVRQDTDTASPRGQIPIYLMHGGTSPFCGNPRCFCQHGKRAGAMLYEQIATGKLLLAQLAASAKVMVDLLPDVPEDCQLYGHSWELTEHRDVKECSLCHVRGYCPGCTPIAPAGAQPFACTTHAGRQAQQ